MFSQTEVKIDYLQTTKQSLLSSVLIKQKSYQYFQFTRASNMEYEYTGHFILLWGANIQSGRDATAALGCSTTYGH